MRAAFSRPCRASSSDLYFPPRSTPYFDRAVSSSPASAACPAAAPAPTPVPATPGCPAPASPAAAPPDCGSAPAAPPSCSPAPAPVSPAPSPPVPRSPPPPVDRSDATEPPAPVSLAALTPAVASGSYHLCPRSSIRLRPHRDYHATQGPACTRLASTCVLSRHSDRQGFYLSSQKVWSIKNKSHYASQSGACRRSQSVV